MRRCTWIMVGLLALAMEARSEVVNFAAAGDNGNTGNFLNFSAGVTFTTNGSSAGSGGWALQNFSFYLGTTNITDSFNLTGARVSLFRDVASNGNYAWVGKQDVTLAGPGVNVASGTNSLIGLGLSGSVFGTVGNESTGLVAGGKYLLTVDRLSVTGDGAATAGTDGYFVASSSASTGVWSPVSSYSGTVDDLSGGYEFPSLGTVTSTELGGSPFSNNMYTQLSAVAVPEPGTLILGGIAAVSGGAGAWWRRRKNRKSTAEQAA